MNAMLNQIQNILNRQISGFHQYRLRIPAQLSYVSQNLCDMLGVTGEELRRAGEDPYAALVHPEDRNRYTQFIEGLTADGKMHTAQYRLLRKDGTLIWVLDTMSVERDGEGALVGNSVLTDITELKKETDDLRFLNETIPCGFLKYTCDKQPRITYINQTMLELLRLTEPVAGAFDYLEMCKNDIFLLIPMEERCRFSLYLDRVYASNTPLAGEMTLLRRDGTRARVFGWVTKHRNAMGVEEFQSVCMDITQRHDTSKSKENERYLNALTDIYDKIFAFDLDANTLTCLHCEEESSFQCVEGIAMQTGSALEKWIAAYVVTKDQLPLQRFIQDFCQKKLYGPDAKPPQISYRAKTSDGMYHQYVGVFIKVDGSIGYYCCRRTPDIEENRALRQENDQLKKLVSSFMDGFAAFELSADGRARPLYSSENVFEFFGYTEEAWLELIDTFTPIEHFIANSEGGQENFEKLLRTGEAEFIYFDYKSESKHCVKAVCSQREADSQSPRYVMLYEVGAASSEAAKLMEAQNVQIRTFGYFDVFVGERPIAFRNKKAEELLALLVDRRGGYISSEDAICFLWENESVNSVTLARYRKAALQLKNTLEEYGIADIVESVDGKRRIVPEKIQCDLYQYLSGKEEYAQLFQGSYLTNYSWSENTLGALTLQQEQKGN